MQDSNVVQERDGSKTVYILLPYFRRGNLQDTINANLINGTYYDEKEALALFAEIARGVQVMHKHSATDRNSAAPSSRSSGMGIDFEDDRPLMAEPELIRTPQTLNPSAEVRQVAYAHRDIKPANIMLSQSGLPVLMDLGSCMRARVNVSSRAQALEIQDNAAEHCTMPYRAPELFDVKTDAVLDEGVDIWSLGCTFFALLYCSSPFELQTDESGASLSLAIMNGQYRFPDAPKYSEATKEMIRACLTVEPTKRPNIDEIIHLIRSAQSQFN